MMELYIETLTGAAFELRVSPFETIMSVKAKIQRIEGIPIAQQHLIWKSIELEDDYCLHDYSIHDGATLKLVLAMRGGPINTRRIPMEDPALREMVEYVEANREDIWEKLPGNRQVTLLVFREGDQLNFFRVVDRGDGTLTPLSESLRYDNDDPALMTDFNGASMYNFNDEEEEEDAPTKEKVEENEQLKEKMKQIRSKMDKLNISKKPHRKPHPPTSGRANSRSSRLRHLPSTSYSLGPTLNRNLCLPPVGGHAVAGMSQSLALQHSLLKERIERLDREEEKERSTGATYSSTLRASVASDKLVDVHDEYTAGASGGLSEAAAQQLDSIEKLSQALSSVIEDSEKHDDVFAGYEAASRLALQCDKQDLREKLVESKETSQSHSGTAEGAEGGLNGKVSTNCDTGSVCEPGGSSHKKGLRLSHTELGESKSASSTRPVTSSKIKDVTLESLRSTSSSKGKSKLKASDYSLLDSLRETIGATSSMSRHSSLEKRKEFTLESLSTSEARAMSGLLRQASLEKVGSSRIGNVTVTSASRNRLTGNYTLGNSTFPDGRITTPEGRLVSARLQRITTSRDGRLLSPSHRLPPVKSKKKASKRCFVCAKKTGLACSYTCRCGNNFCASHRYAESHDCTFDYKTEGRKLLEQNNPVVSAPKLPKI